MGKFVLMSVLYERDLVRDFRSLGLTPGMKLMVHSSLRSLGYVVGGPQTVVNALMESLGEGGVLMMPSFNHGAPFQPGGSGFYSREETPTTNGAIPEYFRKLPDVLRTLDPTHPFAAWGKDARFFLKDHHRTKTMGPDSPLGRLWKAGGYCLLLGVDYGPNTFKHVVEMTLGVPCLGVRTEAYPVRLADGRMVSGRTWAFRERSCPISDPATYARQEMERRGLHIEGRVGEARCLLFKLDDFSKVLRELLSDGIAGHLPCHRCSIKPAKTPFTVESDWDFENDRLRPDSEAWTYEDGL